LKRLVLLIIFLAAPQTNGDAGETPVATFLDPACAVTFNYPASWTAVANPTTNVWAGDSPRLNTVCTIGLHPPGWTEERKASPLTLQEYPITVAVIYQPFLRVAREAGFTRMRDLYESSETRPPYLRDLGPTDWTLAMRQGDAPASQFRTQCCQGIRGETWGNTQAKDGAKATFTAEIAVLNDRNRHSAILATDGADKFRAVLTRLISSFRFVQSGH
jgi:hypothetical protein